MDKVQLENSEEYIYGHPSYACARKYCTLHNRSDHSMRSFPQHWRSDRAIMERICSHGVGHPDPDEKKLTISKYEGLHGCDGCCS